MKLHHGLHLAYCTNVHPAETWAETWAALDRCTLAVKERLGRPEPYAIGLRLSDLASRELLDPKSLLQFQRWLEKHGCYVFTINGFPYGQFHGTRVKEQVYSPDWTTDARLAYTKRLFDVLAKLLPAGVEGSVSTLPGSFKEFVDHPGKLQLIRDNLWRCVEHMASLSQRTGSTFHLGLEPEPLGLFENSTETIEFFERLREQHPGDDRLERHLGVNYDTCHFAIEYEEPRQAIARLRSRGIRLSKIHLSNALKVVPSSASLERLSAFADDVYLHQVVVRLKSGKQIWWRDLPPAIASARRDSPESPIGEEWRVHFHVPLQCELADTFATTSDHATGVLDVLAREPSICSHLEMETYTWAVLPDFLKSRDVVDQIVSEYHWTLTNLAERGLASSGLSSQS